MPHTCDARVNARNLLCPMPVIRTQQAIRHLPEGATLLLEATDPGVQHDIPAWCRVHGHHILDMHDADGVMMIRIQVGITP